MLKNISTIFKEQLNTISAVLNSTGNTTKLLTSFNALDVAQQKVLLSSKLLTEEQKSQCLTMATLSSANTKYTAEQLTKATGISAETLATWGLTEATDTLTMSQLAEMASSDAQAKTVLEKIVAQNAQAVANGEVTASNIALASSEGGVTLATGAFTTAIKANIKAMWTWMTTTPLGWLTLLAAGIFVAVKAYDALNVSAEEANEKIDESRSAYEETTSTIESMNFELETTKKRIEELEAKDALSFTDKAELDNLREQNAELERSIFLLEKKRQNEAKQTVVDIKQNQETLDEDFDKSIKNLSEYKKEYEETRQLGIKGMAQGAVTLENYEATMAAMDKTMGQYESSVLDNIEKYEQYKEDIINKYGTNDISTFSQSDRALYNDIVSQLQTAYKEIYTNSEYNKFVIEPIFNQEDLKGLQDELLKYFINGGHTDLSSLEEKFGTDIITALRSACEKAGIDFDKMIGDIYNNSQSKLNQIAPIVTTPTGAYDAKQNSISKQIRDYIQNDLSEEDRTILLNAEIPDDVKFRTKQDVDNYIASLKADVDTDKTDILSFSEAWNAEDFSKAKDELLALAEAGQLTPETLQSTEEYKKLLEQTGMSAEEAAKKINSMTNASTQLQSMSAQISKMSDMLADKKNGTVTSASDLAGFDATIKGLESWDEFERVMGSSKSSMEECQQAANALATEWVSNGNYLANLTDENKDYYITQLNNMGIENAETIVTEALTQKKNDLALATQFAEEKSKDLSKATVDEITKFADEHNMAGEARNALYRLALAKKGVSAATLTFDGDITNIKNFVQSISGAAYALAEMEAIKKNPSAYVPSEVKQRILDQARTEVSNAVNTPVEVDIDLKEIGSSGYKPTSTGKSKSGGSGSSKSDTKQTIDWIERKISSLNNNIDLTESKLNNLFNIKTPKGLSKQITDVSNKLKKASDNTDKWKSKLSKIKIPDSAKKLIQDEKNVNLSKYSKTERKNIKKYQSTWKSYSSAKKKENSLYNQKWDLETQKGKEALLKYQEKDYNTLAKIEEKAYKKYMSKAKSVKLSSSLKKKVQSGDYKISDYSSKTQSLIQEYQDWWNKAQDANKGKYEAKKNARDKKSERYRLYIDNAENNIAKLDAQMENSSSYKERIKYLKEERDYIKDNYYYQIKQAELNGELVKADELRAKRQKELTDNTIAQYQEKVDDAEAKIAKSQVYAELDAGNYKEQNKHLEYQKKQLKTQYDYLIKIAKLNKDSVEVAKLKAEYQKELNDLTMQEFDNIANTYDNKVGLNNNKIKAFQDQISLLEAKGQKIGSALYTKQMSLNNINEKKLIAEREKLIEKLNEIPKGTDDWYKAQDTLFSVESELVNVQIENANLQKSINQLKFDRFDDLLDKLNDIVDETDFLIDMLDSENFFDDNGKITDDGITAMGLNAQKYDVYLAEAQKYKQMLSDVKDMYDADKISLEEYEEYQRKYSQSQRDAIKNANDCKKAVIDYVREGLEKQNQALSDSISKQKELLQQQKD